MVSSPSIHDNVLVAYRMDLLERILVLETRFPSHPAEETIVIFGGVIAYDFCHDSCLGTILFGIDEGDPLALYDAQHAAFVKGLPYGWPGEWAASRQSAAEFFTHEGIRAWYVESSVGMSGWILARTLVVKHEST